MKKFKKFFFLFILLIVTTIFVSEKNSPGKDSYTYDLDNKISMEEMKIRGKIDKPL